MCSNGDVLLMGSEYDIAAQGYAGMITRIAPNGNLLWNTHFSYAGHDLFPVAAEMQGADFIVAVQDYQQSAGIAAVDFIKIDANGSLVWEMRYTNTNPNSSLLPYDLIKTGSNEYIVVAQRSGPQLGSILLKVDGSGQYIDSRFYADYTITSIDNYGQWRFSLTGTADSLNDHFIALKTVDDDGAGCDDTTAVFGVGPVTYTSVSGGTVINYPLVAVNGNLSAVNTNLIGYLDCAVTGIGDQPGNEISVSLYPVPADNQLRIAATGTISSVEVIDINGRIVYTANPRTTVFEMQTSGLPQSVYTARITTSSGTTLHQFIIQH
jgi:hypothetical protein